LLQLLDQCPYIRPATRTQDGINARHSLRECIAPPLRQTSGRDQHLLWTLLTGHLPQLVYRFLSGVLDKAARIHDEYLGLTRIIDRQMTKVFEQASHPLGVHQILGAAQRLEVVLHNPDPI
jgi:hypothetical protein